MLKYTDQMLTKTPSVHTTLMATLTGHPFIKEDVLNGLEQLNTESNYNYKFISMYLTKLT